MKALKSALAVAGVTAAALFAFTAPAYAGGHGDGHDGGYSNGHGHGHGHDDGDDDGFSQDSDDNYGFLNGTQVGIPIDLDLDISCNAIAILGAASSHCD